MKAIVGPDGCGKSYTIEQWKKEGNVVSSRHAMPITRWLPIKGIKNRVYFIIKEILNGIERNIIYIIVKLEKPDILDRCFLDGCAYSEFFSMKYKCPTIRTICEIFNPFAPIPDEVIQLRVTRRDRWKPKRGDTYSWEDAQLMNTIYMNILWEKGYRIVKKEEYYLGERWYWRRFHDEKRTRVFDRFKRRTSYFLSGAIARNRVYKSCSAFWRLRIKGERI